MILLSRVNTGTQFLLPGTAFLLKLDLSINLRQVDGVFILGKGRRDGFSRIHGDDAIAAGVAAGPAPAAEG